MRKIIVLLLFTVAMFAFPSKSFAVAVPDPPADGFVLDSLGWFTADQKTELKLLLSNLDKDTTNQIAVVTLNDCGDDTRSFRNTLFRSWGIGQKDKNNGLLILVCWYNGDKIRRKLETEVGYGLEGVLPDLLTSNYAKQYFVPVFTGGDDQGIIKSGKAGAALISLVKAYDNKLRGESAETPIKNQTDWASIAKWLIIALILYLCIDGFLFHWAIAVFILEIIGTDSDSISSSGGWSSSSGGDSGGGFGGGSSGGGGSSTDF